MKIDAQELKQLINHVITYADGKNTNWYIKSNKLLLASKSEGAQINASMTVDYSGDEQVWSFPFDIKDLLPFFGNLKEVGLKIAENGLTFVAGKKDSSGIYFGPPVANVSPIKLPENATSLEMVSSVLASGADYLDFRGAVDGQDLTISMTWDTDGVRIGSIDQWHAVLLHNTKAVKKSGNINLEKGNVLLFAKKGWQMFHHEESLWAKGKNILIKVMSKVPDSGQIKTPKQIKSLVSDKKVLWQGTLNGKQFSELLVRSSSIREENTKLQFDVGTGAYKCTTKFGFFEGKIDVETVKGKPRSIHIIPSAMEDIHGQLPDKAKIMVYDDLIRFDLKLEDMSVIYFSALEKGN